MDKKNSMIRPQKGSFMLKATNQTKGTKGSKPLRGNDLRQNKAGGKIVK
jgi:hypothetical protein